MWMWNDTISKLWESKAADDGAREEPCSWDPPKQNEKEEHHKQTPLHFLFYGVPSLPSFFYSQLLPSYKVTTHPN